MYMHHGVFFICQLPSCNLFTQHVIYLLWRDTTSVDPSPFLNLIIQTIANPCSLSFTVNKHHFPHCASNPLFQQDRRYWQPHCFFGGKIAWLCCVQVSRSLLTPVVRPANASHLHLQKWFLPHTGSIKPWFHTKGKLLLCYTKPSSWGIPT